MLRLDPSVTATAAVTSAIAASAVAGGPDLPLRQFRVPGFAPTNDVFLREGVDDPYGIGAADLDGDGLVEVVLAGRVPHVVSTDGSRFGRPVAIDAAAHPTDFDWSSVAFIDFEGDGDLDVLFGDGFRRVMSVRNDGPAGFAVVGLEQSTLTSVGAIGARIAVAPAAGDVPRMVLAPSGDGITGWPLAADGSFGEQVLASDAPAYQIRLLDADGNGLLDIVAAAQGDGVSLALRHADGTWEPSSNLVAPGGGTITDLDAADLDGDGHVDVVAARAAGDMHYEVLMNDPSGLFAPAFDAGLRTCSAGAFTSIEILDANGDGHLDLLAVPAFNNPCMSIDFGDGTGGFTRGPERATPFNGGRPIAVDFDTDGRSEIVLAQPGIHGADFGGGVAILREITSSRFGDSVLVELGPSSALPRPFDLDPGANDGDELIVVDRDEDRVIVYATEPAGVPVPVDELTIEGELSGVIAVASATGSESALTAFAIDAGDATLIDLFAVVDGAFEFIERIEAPANTIRLALADMDGDGTRDLVAGSRFPLGLTVIRRTPEGPVVTSDEPLPFTGSQYMQFGVGDLDGDGVEDVVAASAAGLDRRLWFVRGEGGGTLGPIEEVADVNASVYLLGWALADWNGDGRVNVVGPSSDGTMVEVVSVAGPGAPATVTSFATVGSQSPFQHVGGVDIDGDGDQDLVAFTGSEADRDLIVIVNRSSEGLAPRRFTTALGTSIGPIALETPLVADLDGDGFVDLVGDADGGQADPGVRAIRFGGPGPDACDADLDLDGEVGMSDLLAVLSDFAVPGRLRFARLADLDENGAIGFDDILGVLGAWGPCPSAG